MEDRTPLLPSARASPLETNARRRRHLYGFGAASAIVFVVALSSTRDGLFARALGAVTEWRGVNGKLLPPLPGSDQNSLRTFTVYDHCISEAAREEGFRRDFWNSPRAGAKIVRHNYDTSSFFDYDDGIALSRTEISDGLYAWTTTTNQVDWEFGFALANDAGDTFYDIGTSLDPTTNEQSPLAVEGLECAQMYGKYFNRVITHEENPLDVSYVFGSCNRTCAAGYTDTAFASQPLSDKLESPATNPSASVDLGESRDARLIVPQTVMFYADSQDQYVGMNPHLRTGMQKDADFVESKDAVRWIVGGIDYWRMYLKMAKIEIYLDNGRAKMRFVSQKRHTLDANKGYPYRTKAMNDWRVNNAHVVGCTNVYCDPTQYDLTTLFNDPTNADMNQYVVQALQYKSLKVGDSAPTVYSLTTGIQSEPNCKTSISGITCTAAQRASSHFLEGAWGSGANAQRTLFEAGQWGPDIDARRVIVKSGVLCSYGQNYENCMYAVAVPFNPGSGTWKGYSGPTKTRKQWILASLVGMGWKMARIEVFVSAGALKIKAVDSALDHTSPASDFDQDTGDALLKDMSNHYKNPTHSHGPYRDWTGTNGEEMGVGGVYYDLAGTMVPSLTGYDSQVLPIT